ncbi:MAG TPA: chemotaxis protein CheW [Cyanobacteria bacterium UBA8803]|nr:chemotaxis protein CheW [Cyanobacteria bacterium UBA9273]HBL61737.1 chemotaxis protein CheW [Cyanobacteria bacterium UBA8803]
MPIQPPPTNALALIPTKSLPGKNQGDAYLKFQFGQQTPAVLSMNQAQEVIVLPTSRLTAMPNMPAYVLGLMNRRSRVLWAIDLGRMLGLNGIETNVQQYNAVIIRSGSASLGLIVDAVEGVVRFTPDTIQAPNGQVSAALVPYLRGCTLQEKEILLVLDAEAIIRDADGNG